MNEKADAGQFYTVRQMAEREKVSEKTIRRAIKAGDLKVHRFGPSGRLVRISPEDRRAYEAARRH